MRKHTIIIVKFQLNTPSIANVGFLDNTLVNSDFMKHAYHEFDNADAGEYMGK